MTCRLCTITPWKKKMQLLGMVLILSNLNLMIYSDSYFHGPDYKKKRYSLKLILKWAIPLLLMV
jgi:hypothetical protein